jgi:glycosyltransferase involved in cell wall biosynthesis
MSWRQKTLGENLERASPAMTIRRELKLCHIAATSEGAAWMVDQLRGLRDKHGYAVSAIIGAGEGALGEKLRQHAIPFKTFAFEFPPQKDWRAFRQQVNDLAAILRAEKFDIVQTHLFSSMVVGRLAAWLADVPVRLAMIAGPYHLEAYTPRWVDGSTCWMETALIASCEFTRQQYRDMGVANRRIHLTYYGQDHQIFQRESAPAADLHAEFGIAQGAKIVGMIAYFYAKMPPGRWTPPLLHNRANKRQLDLIHAAPKVLEAYPDTCFLFVGGGWGAIGEQELLEARQAVADLNISHAVIFAGRRNDVNNVLAALDVTVQASISENLGGTIEALLMECPTVATATGGLVDSVLDGKTGVLVKPLDPADLARGIVQLLSDPGAARQMAREGRNLMVQRFSLECTIRDLDVVYCGYALRGTRIRRGYRPWKMVLRSQMACPVYWYLERRLRWDAQVLTQWDAGWRPFGRSRAAASRVLSTIARQPGRVKAYAAGLVQSLRLFALRRPRSVTDTLKALFVGFAKTVSSAMAAFGSAIAAIPRRAGSALVAASTRTSKTLRAIYHWCRLKPLYAYGYVRYLLRDTPTLKRWDIFFNWVRNRQPPA